MLDWLIFCVVFSSVLTVITIVAYLLYSNFVAEITVQTGCPPIKKFTFAYTVKRSYETTGQLFKESHSIGPKLPQVAVFYDDPKKVILITLKEDVI